MEMVTNAHKCVFNGDHSTAGHGSALRPEANHRAAKRPLSLNRADQTTRVASLALQRLAVLLLAPS